MGRAPLDGIFAYWKTGLCVNEVLGLLEGAGDAAIHESVYIFQVMVKA